jgi:hypothetical protein
MPDIREEILATARDYIGRIGYRSYRLNQSVEEGMCCYGFLRFVLSKHGIYVPDSVGALEFWTELPPVDAPKGADLLFKNGRQDHRPGHVGFFDPDKRTLIHLAKRIGFVAETGINGYPVMGYRSIEPYLAVR